MVPFCRRVEAAHAELDTALTQQKRESGQALQELRDQLAAVTAKAARLQASACCVRVSALAPTNLVVWLNYEKQRLRLRTLRRFRGAVSSYQLVNVYIAQGNLDTAGASETATQRRASAAEAQCRQLTLVRYCWAAGNAPPCLAHCLPIS